MKLFKILSFVVLSGSMGYMETKAGTIISDKYGWHRIAQKTVDLSGYKEEISIKGEEKFSAIKFIVKDTPIKLKNVELMFETGNDQSVNLNHEIKKYGQSHVLAIKGGERVVKKIFFTYSTKPDNKVLKAQLEIWGLKTTNHETISKSQTGSLKKVKSVSSVSPSQPDGDNLTYQKSVNFQTNAGWKMIAERKIDLTSEKDEIIFSGTNRCTQLKFKILDAAINMVDVNLQFNTGEDQNIVLNSELDPVKESTEINIKKGLERDLVKISFRYKSSQNNEDKTATVEIWGNNNDSQTSQSMK